MPSYRRLRGACHNIGHHAVSGLCFVLPEVKRLCRLAGVDQITLDLREADPTPAVFAALGARKNLFGRLRSEAWRMIANVGFGPADLSALTLRYEMPDPAEREAHLRSARRHAAYVVGDVPSGYSPENDHYSMCCSVRIVTRAGKEISRSFDWLGRGRGVHRPKTRLPDYPPTSG